MEPTEAIAGRYQILGTLGAGGSATVYRAMDGRLGVERALKLLHHPDPEASAEARARLAAEARAMASVDHPGVVRVFELGTVAGLDFVVMELIDGGTLAQRLAAQGPLPLPLLRQVGMELLDVLAVAHAAGVIHRDIKPQNLLLDLQGHLRLGDFGIARLTQEDGRLTRTGTFMGSLAYMAPEQRLDARQAGVGADLYAVGSTLYHLATGESPMDLFMADEARWAAVPAPLRSLLRRATQPLPADRFASAAAMRAALEALPAAPVGAPARSPAVRTLPPALTETLAAPPPRTAPPREDPPPRPPSRKAVDLAILVGILVGLCLLAFGPQAAPDPPTPAAEAPR